VKRKGVVSMSEKLMNISVFRVGLPLDLNTDCPQEVSPKQCM
jgi:hypothetical protein